MALQSSGAIKLSEIQTEFGGSNPISLSEYYGSDTVPESGVISLSDFYGTAATIHILPTQTNEDLTRYSQFDGGNTLVYVPSLAGTENAANAQDSLEDLYFIIPIDETYFSTGTFGSSASEFDGKTLSYSIQILNKSFPASLRRTRIRLYGSNTQASGYTYFIDTVLNQDTSSTTWQTFTGTYAIGNTGYDYLALEFYAEWNQIYTDYPIARILKLDIDN